MWKRQQRKLANVFLWFVVKGSASKKWRKEGSARQGHECLFFLGHWTQLCFIYLFGVIYRFQHFHKHAKHTLFGDPSPPAPQNIQKNVYFTKHTFFYTLKDIQPMSFHGYKC